MGRQIAIAAAPSDERLLLDIMRASAEIRLFVPCAPTPEQLWVDDLEPFGTDRTTYYAWNTAFPWSPSYGTVNLDVPHRGGWSFVADRFLGEAPVLEFVRTDMSRLSPPHFLGRGRLYVARTGAGDDFVKWYESIVRKIRKIAVRIDDRTSGIAIFGMPEAVRILNGRGAAD